jgi:hypothetical protein
MTQEEKIDKAKQRLDRAKYFKSIIQMEDRLVWSGRFTREQLAEDRLKRQRKQAVKQRVKQNIHSKGLNMCATFTLNEKQDRSINGLASVQERMQYAFKKLGIEYCLMPEYHEDCTFIHFHGFIRVEDKTLLQPKYYAKGKKKGQRVIDYGCPIYELPYFEDNFGYSRLEFLTENHYKIQKQVNYMLKYVTKSNDFNLMSSRAKKGSFKAYSKAIALFGLELVKFEA